MHPLMPQTPHKDDLDETYVTPLTARVSGILHEYGLSGLDGHS